LPFTPQNETAVEILEKHDPTNTYGLLGALRLVAGRICIQPISLFGADEIINLNLEQTSVTATTRVASDKSDAAAKESDVEEVLAGADEDEPMQAGSATPLGRFLITAQADVESLAESGIAVRHDPELLKSAARRLEGLGLTSCAGTLVRLVEAVSRSTKLAESEARDYAAGTLLHAYYVLHLASDHETVAAACSGFG